MKNVILKTIMSIIGIIFIVSACLLDSENSIPFFVMIFCMGILILFLYANNFFKGIDM